MTGKRYKSVGANLKCSNGMEYMLVKRDDGFNICQVCSKYTAKEIVDELNNLADENEELKEEIARQKYTKHIMRENMKRLRNSFEEFDEMRLERIRFLEKRLKKNGLSIYVNDCGDIE